MKRIIAISICLVFVLSASTIPLAQERMEKRMTFKEFKEMVYTSIQERNENLVSLFKEEKYDKMAEIFSRYSKIVTHEDKEILARESADYWRKVAKLGGTDLHFKLKFFTGWELMLREKPHPEETDFVIFEISMFSFTIGSNGDDTNGGRTESAQRHRVMCEID
ncbi:MAG: hypothetical protein GTN73_00490 [Candidatus Aminicenantes bacterium]|nr:hypothetical protein [Candidatus Aminicenantes bacterium]